MPVTRFIVRRPSNGGGITIRLVHDDPQSVVIRFFDDRGLDITEDTQRKIERLFNREDFRRVFPGEIGDIGFAPRALEHYATALEATVDIEQIRAAEFKVVIDYAYGSTSFAMPNVLAKLGLEVLAVNPFVSTAGVMRGDLATPRRQRGRPGAGVGLAPRRRARPRRRAADPHRRRGPRPLRLRGAARPAHAAAGQDRRRPGGAAGLGDAGGHRPGARLRRVRWWSPR